MAKKEVATDLWVHDLLVQADISFDAQGSTIKELDDALKRHRSVGRAKSDFRGF